MFVKLYTLLAILKLASGSDENHDWDLAVAVSGQIELLNTNGSLVGFVEGNFNKLKALSFDNIRHHFVVSDMDQDNIDTIYSLDLTKKFDYTPIAHGLPDDVQGLAVDPIEDVLYWTDAVNHTINYQSLKEDKPQIHNLFHFKDATPQDIAVDACRRYIYWTNSLRRRPTIERAQIGTKNIEIIVDTDLVFPSGLTIDYRTERIYWADNLEGIYYRLESTNLLGKEREIVHQGIHAEPFGIAIKDEYLYFTDLRQNALWKYDLAKTSQPVILKRFERKPMGLIARKEQIKTLPDCQVLQDSYKNYSRKLVDVYEHVATEEEKRLAGCINGVLQDGKCTCNRGYSGDFCEISYCHNWCFHGSCHLDVLGFPRCRCPRGFGGSRCEVNCFDYCLNGGVCSFAFEKVSTPNCTCPEGFKGPRCEINEVMEKLCDVYCSEDGNENVSGKEYAFCKCKGKNFDNLLASQSPEALMSNDSSESYINYFQDPVFITMIGVTFSALTICLVLTVVVIYLRRKPSPRIRRRYIVNKNSPTSMTERPQQPERCEIVIENCCNMQICETPCFDPSKLQDDKRMLIPNMERSDDIY